MRIEVLRLEIDPLKLAVGFWAKTAGVEESHLLESLLGIAWRGTKPLGPDAECSLDLGLSSGQEGLLGDLFTYPTLGQLVTKSSRPEPLPAVSHKSMGESLVREKALGLEFVEERFEFFARLCVCR